jgi:hypothetical protein
LSVVLPIVPVIVVFEPTVLAEERLLLGSDSVIVPPPLLTLKA